MAVISDGAAGSVSFVAEPVSEVSFAGDVSLSPEESCSCVLTGFTGVFLAGLVF